MFKLLAKNFQHFHFGQIIGVGLYTLSLFFYHSFVNRPILGLWSYPFFVVIVFSTLLFLIILVKAWRKHSKNQQPEDHIRFGSLFFELAILFWGVAYFISTVDDSANAGRITDLNFFGSIAPIAVCFEWISLIMLLISALLFVSPLLKTKWTQTVVLILGTTIGFLLMTEGVIRGRAVIAPITQGFPTYTSALWGRYYASLNQEGFRDLEHSKSKDPETHRLLVVGDSFAFGDGLKSIQDRIGSQVVKRLITQTNEKWEVINASRGDTHTLEHIEFLKAGLNYKPDVIFLLYVFNDIDYLFPVTPRKDFSALSRFLFINSYLFQEIYLRVRRIKAQYFAEEKTDFDPYLDHSILSRHLQDISKFVKLASRHGALVRVIPFAIDITFKDTLRDRYQSFLDECEVANIPVWSIEKVFDNFQFSQLVVNNMDTHPNELANRVAAEEIAKQLLRELGN